MKVKRFNNIWAMGLILFGAILIAFYVLKIFFPEFIIGVAETPKIVELGTIIQNNKWYLRLFNLFIGYTHGYIYCCACCRVGKLDWKGNVILLVANIVLLLIMEFYPEYYNTLNYVGFISTPFLICLATKKLNNETFISTAVCFCADLTIQILSLVPFLSHIKY